MNKINHTFCEETLKLKNDLERNFLELGARLARIRDEKLYAPQWANFASYCDEMKLAESVASRLISVYQHFILGLGVAPELVLRAGGWSAAYEVKRLATSKDSAERWLRLSQQLTLADLRKEITEQKTGIAQADCSHTDSYLLSVCRTCSFKTRVHDEA